MFLQQRVFFYSKLPQATWRKQSFPYGFCNVRHCSSPDTIYIHSGGIFYQTSASAVSALKAALYVSSLLYKVSERSPGKGIFYCFLNLQNGPIITSPGHSQLSAPAGGGDAVPSPVCPPPRRLWLSPVPHCATGCSRATSTPVCGTHHVTNSSSRRVPRRDESQGHFC